MNAAYDLIAAAARYWFIALAALILFQLICALRREARMEKKVARQIDRAGVRPAAELWLLGMKRGASAAKSRFSSKRRRRWGVRENAIWRCARPRLSGCTASSPLCRRG